MTSEEALTLIVRLAGFKLLVRANRFGCDTEFARKAHDEVLEILEGWRLDLAGHIDLNCAVARETDPGKQDDLAYHLRQRDYVLDRYWHLDEPYFVGGWHNVESGFVSPVTGEPVELGHWPVTQEIPDHMLCGLTPILTDIATECRIEILPEIIFNKPAPRRASSDDAVPPLDPDAEIPW